MKHPTVYSILAVFLNFFILLNTNLEAQLSIDWDTVMGSSGDDLYSCFYKNSIGEAGVVLGARNGLELNSNCYGFGDILEYNLSTQGVLTYKRCLGGSSSENMPMIKSDANRKWFVAYGSSSDGDLSNLSSDWSGDIWVQLYDHADNLIHEDLLGGSAYDVNTDIFLTENGELLILGETYSSDGDVFGGNKGDRDLWLIKLDTLGNMVWNKTYGSSGFESGYSVSQVGSSYLILASTTGQDGDVTPGSSGAWMLLVDQNGNKLWDRMIPNVYLGDIASLGDMGFVAVGGSYPADEDILLLYFDMDMQLIKTDIWGGSLYDRGTRVISDQNTGLVYLTGYTRSQDGDFSENRGLSDTWVAITDFAGNMLALQTLGGSGFDIPYNIFLPQADKIWLSVYTTSTDGQVGMSYGGYDVWLLQLSVPPGLSSKTSKPDLFFSVYPNPAYGEVIQVQMKKEYFAEELQVKVRDVNGRTLPLSFTLSESSMEIRLGTMPAGMYYLELSDGKHRQVQPLQLIH